MSAARAIARRYPLGALALAALGLALYAHVMATGGAPRAIVEAPLSLAVGETRTASFRANANAIYDIELEAQQRLPLQRLDCLLDMELAHPERCAAEPSPVDLAWALSLDGTVLAQGVSGDYRRQGGWSRDTVRRLIGHVSLTPAPGYILAVRSLKDASVLAPTRPKIVVRLGTLDAGDSASLGVFELLASLAVMVAALAWLALWAWRRGRARKADAGG